MPITKPPPNQPAATSPLRVSPSGTQGRVSTLPVGRASPSSGLCSVADLPVDTPSFPSLLPHLRGSPDTPPGPRCLVRLLTLRSLTSSRKPPRCAALPAGTDAPGSGHACGAWRPRVRLRVSLFSPAGCSPRVLTHKQLSSACGKRWADRREQTVPAFGATEDERFP